MPLLSQERFVFPDDLFTKTLGGSSDNWWVLHTRPRAEKALARRLEKHSIPFFLPQYEKRWLSNGRKQSSHLPLFPGYLFLQADAEGRTLALESNLVANCLAVADPDRLQAELADIHRLMNGEAPLTPEQQLTPGTRIEIVDGPFCGLIGRLVRRGSKARFVVDVRMLNQGVSIEIERWTFRPVGEGTVESEKLRATIGRVGPGVA